MRPEVRETFRASHSMSVQQDDSYSGRATVAEWGGSTELYIPCWSDLSRRKLMSPTLATAHYSCPDNAVGLVAAQCELGGYVKLG